MHNNFTPITITINDIIVNSFFSKHNEELENLRAHIAAEMEQEKDEAHNNCQSVS